MRFLTPILLVGLTLSACTIVTEPLPQSSPSPNPTLPPDITPSLSPYPSPSPMPSTPEFNWISASPEELARWQEYEAALGQKLLRSIATGVLCEWQILGRAHEDLYVWARCSGLTEIGQTNPGHPTVEVPAVIHLSADGAVQSIEIPGAGTQYASGIRSLFPPEIQTIIFDDLIDYARLGQRLRWRLEHPGEPPLIVIEATPAS